MMPRQRRLRCATRRTRRDGVTLGMVVVALVVILPIAGLAIDLSIAALGCQRCQNMADAAALAGAQELPYHDLASATASEIGQVNTHPADTEAVNISVSCYARDAEVPGFGPAPYAGAVEVTVSKHVPFHFLRAFGVDSITVTRAAVASKTIPGTCITPMWITDTTPVEYGLPVNLLMADAPHCGIPGSFGFLQPAGGVDFDRTLKGLLTPEEEDLQRVYDGDTAYANTGLGIGHWRGDLKTDSDSRLKRADQDPWADDTFEDFHTNNPRLLIVPFVEYVAGTGSGAYFEVKRFGAFWLEDVIVQGQDRYIAGRFIEFTTPGGTGYGIKATHLIR